MNDNLREATKILIGVVLQQHILLDQYDKVNRMVDFSELAWSFSRDMNGVDFDHAIDLIIKDYIQVGENEMDAHELILECMSAGVYDTEKILGVILRETDMETIWKDREVN